MKKSIILSVLYSFCAFSQENLYMDYNSGSTILLDTANNTFLFQKAHHTGFSNGSYIGSYETIDKKLRVFNFLSRDSIPLENTFIKKNDKHFLSLSINYNREYNNNYDNTIEFYLISKGGKEILLCKFTRNSKNINLFLPEEFGSFYLEARYKKTDGGLIRITKHDSFRTKVFTISDDESFEGTVSFNVGYFDIDSPGIDFCYEYLLKKEKIKSICKSQIWRRM